MATKDNNPGLLSRMAKFVRNPTKDWSELDKPESEPVHDSRFNKQLLKEMVERKRHNDSVRRREFDQLRILRRNSPTAGPADPAGRPSFFQTSTPSNLDERALTIKKIDEIEAQMSQQWWAGKQNQSSGRGANFPVAAPVSAPAPQPTGGDLSIHSVNFGRRESDHQFAITQVSVSKFDVVLETKPIDYPATQMGQTAPAPTPSEPTLRQMTPLVEVASPSLGIDINEFSSSKLFSVDLGDDLADPDLEEAAIRFANGDDVGAEAGLLAALQAEKISPDLADHWAAALFDFYRSIGQQASFDRVAIDYAQRFGRSAPAWFSTPELLGHKPPVVVASVPLPARSKAPSVALLPVWDCPAELDVAALDAFVLNFPRAPAVRILNWSALEVITPDAAKALTALFVQWCEQPIKLHFEGVEVLEKTLSAATPLGNAQVEIFWWNLRLETLRTLCMQDEFELVALDYCVTYEVSPPSWQEARCIYVHESPNAAPVVAGGGVGAAPKASNSESDPSYPYSTILQYEDDEEPAEVVELTGEVFGDSVEALDKLQAELQGANRLVISCARLIRVDFSAAGSILNWVAVRESEGCRVQFHDVPRLVAAFFNVIGINEHARIVLRTT